MGSMPEAARLSSLLHLTCLLFEVRRFVLVVLRHGAVVVGVLNFASEGWCFESCSLPSCHFLHKKIESTYHLPLGIPNKMLGEVPL